MMHRPIPSLSAVGLAILTLSSAARGEGQQADREADECGQDQIESGHR